MAEVPTTRSLANRTATLIGITLIVLNAIFYYLSKVWFGDGKDAAALVGGVRVAFGVLTVVLSGVSFTAVLAPRPIAHSLAALLGLAAFVAGIAAFAKGMPNVMSVTLLIIGCLMPILAWYSLQHSRGAWSFLVALLAVFGAVTFFGAPKVRGLLGINLWIAMLVPGLLVVATVTLSMLRDEYRERI